MSLNTTTTTDLLSKVHQYVADVSFFFFNSEHKMCICKSMGPLTRVDPEKFYSTKRSARKYASRKTTLNPTFHNSFTL